jgi:hypothetical protein
MLMSCDSAVVGRFEDVGDRLDVAHVVRDVIPIQQRRAAGDCDAIRVI